MADTLCGVELQNWLSGKSTDVGGVIAFRCTLRILPLMVRYNSHNREIVSNFALSVFRCVSLIYNKLLELNEPVIHQNISKLAIEGVEVSFAALRYNLCDSLSVETMRSFIRAIKDSFCSALKSNYGTYNVNNVDETVCSTIDAVQMDMALHYRQSAEVNDIWRALNLDYALIEAGTGSIQLAQSVLWHDKAPDWFKDANINLKNNLHQFDQDWNVWTKWFDDRIKGIVANKTLEARRALISQDNWDRGASRINSLILGQENFHTNSIKELYVSSTKLKASGSHQDLDFFISYNEKQENYARWFF